MNMHKDTIAHDLADRAMGGKHILPRLLDRLKGTTPPHKLTAKQFDRYLAHLATCDACQIGVATLAQIADLADPAWDALMAHADPAATVEAVPDAERLAAYAALIEEIDATAAEQRWPQTAAHLIVCPHCQVELMALRQTLRAYTAQFPPADEVSDSFDAFGATLTDDQPLPPVWQSTAPHARRFIAPFTVRVRTLAVHVTHPLPQVKMLPGYQASGGWLGTHIDGLSAKESPSDGFVIDLRDRDDDPHPWVQMRANLRANYTRQALCQISLRFVGSAEDAGEAAQHIPLDILLDGKTYLRGETTDQGIFRCRLDAFGVYAIVVHTAGEDWTIPLQVVADPENDRS